MSMYGQFSTNATVEQRGIILDYDAFQVRIARAGGANEKYSKALETKTRPHRRALQLGSLPESLATKMLHEVYAETVVLGWQTKNDKGVLVDGIEGPKGDILPVTQENLIATFKALPDLFADIQLQSNNAAMFREQLLEDDSKN